jgi:hypothetical protein
VAVTGRTSALPGILTRGYCQLFSISILRAYSLSVVFLSCAIFIKKSCSSCVNRKCIEVVFVPGLVIFVLVFVFVFVFVFDLIFVLIVLYRSQLNCHFW